MKHRKTPPPWQRTLKLSAVGIAAGVFVGAGGTTLALWNTELDFAAQTHSGYEYFAAGTPGATKAAVNGQVTVPINAETAATLKEQRAVAIAVETQSVSQGNLGLRYEIEQPDWGDNIFGAADTTLFRVSSADECTVDAAPSANTKPTSTPVGAEYSATDEPVVEHWCLVAVVDEFPDEGGYANAAKVTAEDPAEVRVEATDEWRAEVTTVLDPANEPSHELTVRYETFRPSVDDS